LAARPGRGRETLRWRAMPFLWWLTRAMAPHLWDGPMGMALAWPRHKGDRGRLLRGLA